MPRNWLEQLDVPARGAAEALIERLSALGCPDPVAWAKHELREGTPQLSRLAFLSHLWSESIDAWRDSHLWIDNLVGDAPAESEPAFADAIDAVRRLLAAGIDRASIGALARFVAYETVFSVVHALDEGYDPEHEGQLPGWALVERDPLGHVTGRSLTHLHEDLPQLEPKEEA